MDETQRQVLDSLVFNDIDPETEERLAKRVFWKAYGLLEDGDEVRRQGINVTSDDDPTLTVKERRVLYQSGENVCTLLLTNMDSGVYGDRVSPDKIRLEVFPDRRPEEVVSYYYTGEILFALDKEGTISSPFHLIEATIADSIIDLFDPVAQTQEAPKLI
jgi:hypothetical protein